MSRYYQRYDGYGEPRTILPPAPSYPAGEPMEPRFEHEARAAIDADALYDNLRHEGYSDTEARAILKEKGLL